MEINTIAAFLSFFEKIRGGTKRIIEVIPKDKMDWTYKAGKFTIGDLVRHLAAIERNVFAEIAIGNPPGYKGCGNDLADGYHQVLEYFNEMHKQSMTIFSSLQDEDLNRRVKTLSNSETKLSSFLRALITHEIHHCGALCIYLNLLDIETPPIFGLTQEQAKQKCNSEIN